VAGALVDARKLMKASRLDHVRWIQSVRKHCVAELIYGAHSCESRVAVSVSIAALAPSATNITTHRSASTSVGQATTSARTPEGLMATTRNRVGISATSIATACASRLRRFISQASQGPSGGAEFAAVRLRRALGRHKAPTSR